MFYASSRRLLLLLLGRTSVMASASASSSSTFAAGARRPTVAILVIGDEILKGATQDTNSHFLCKRLHKLGVTVKTVSVVGDELDTIAAETRRLAAKHDWLLTSGGVGPTHDDKTFQGLALAFDDSLSVNPEMERICAQFLPTIDPKGSPAFIRHLSTIPSSAELLWGTHTGKDGEKSRSVWPTVRIRNVLALPGVPRFCERAFLSLESELFGESAQQRRFQRTLHVALSEFEFSDRLTALADRHPTVSVGSYPVLDSSYYKTRLELESDDAQAGETAFRELRDMLAESVVFFDHKPWRDSVQKLAAFRQRELAKADGAEFVARLDEALRVVEEVLDQYSLDQLAISFNGGKDCTAVLHLLRIAVDKKFGPAAAAAKSPLFGFHVLCEDQFPELSQFLLDAARLYSLTLLELSGPLKSGLAGLVRQRPHVQAALMGSRASDPTGRYMRSHRQPTDGDWPPLLRVAPILRWSYSDVWRFLRGLCVPYCVLYDRGYTSLGGRDSTLPNPALQFTSQHTGKIGYRPAYTLADDGQERNGRANL